MLSRELMKTNRCSMIKLPFLQAWILLCFFLVNLSWVKASDAISFDPAAVSAFNSFLDPVDEDRVARYIEDFLKYSQSTEEMLGRGFRYFPLIEKELSRQGLPEQLKVIPIIESRFNPSAVSRVGAVGLWQIMMPTGRELGLMINRHIDERRDPAKATVAAIEYLRLLYERYQDWTLAFAAYNAGPGTVNRAIRHAGGERSFKAIKPFLPRETQLYIPKYIAAQYIVEHYLELGMTPLYPSLDFQLTGHVVVHKYLTLDNISQVTDLPKDLVSELNPGLRRGYVPSLTKGYDLVLPKRVIPTFEYFLATDEALPNPFEYRTYEHVVDESKSIYEVASQLGVDPYLLKYWNHLNSDMINGGQTLMIHELFDPSQAAVEEEPPPMEKVDELIMLPKQIDAEWMQSRLVQIEKQRQEEHAWQLHQDRH